jgi:hypothetical protein
VHFFFDPYSEITTILRVEEPVLNPKEKYYEYTGKVSLCDEF